MEQNLKYNRDMFWLSLQCGFVRLFAVTHGQSRSLVVSRGRPHHDKGLEDPKSP